MSKMKANDLHQFQFEKKSSRCYRVIYTTEHRGDFWGAFITDKCIIDKIKNADWAKAKDIEYLRRVVKRFGSHYSSRGKRLD